MIGQRQVCSQQARTVEEASCRNAQTITSGHIWVGKDQIAWIENGDVFSVVTKLRFATLDESGNLYSLDGQSLNLRLETVNGGGRIGAESHPHAIAKFSNLANGSES